MADIQQSVFTRSFPVSPILTMISLHPQNLVAMIRKKHIYRLKCLFFLLYRATKIEIAGHYIEDIHYRTLLF